MKDIKKEVDNIKTNDNEKDNVEIIGNDDIGLPLMESPKIKTVTFQHGIKKIHSLDGKTTISFIRTIHKQVNDLTRINNMMLKENETLKKKIVVLLKKHQEMGELIKILSKKIYGDDLFDDEGDNDKKEKGKETKKEDKTKKNKKKKTTKKSTKK